MQFGRGDCRHIDRRSTDAQTEWQLTHLKTKPKCRHDSQSDSLCGDWPDGSLKSVLLCKFSGAFCDDRAGPSSYVTVFVRFTYWHTHTHPVLDCVHIFSTYNYSIYNSLYNIHTAYSWWCRISLSFNCTASLVAGMVKISPQCTYIHRYSCSARSTHTVAVS